MKFEKCKKLLRKLSSGIKNLDESRLLKSLPTIASKRFEGKQVFDSGTGNYGYVTSVREGDSGAIYTIDWTSYGTYGGFPKIIKEEYETLDQFLVLDR